MNRRDAASHDWAATAALAAVAAYGWVHAANEGFYGSYGVTVAEVGLDYQPLLARTLVVGGAFAVIAVAFAAVAAASLLVAVAGMRGADLALDRAIDIDALGPRELAVAIAASIVLVAASATLILRDDPNLAVVLALLTVAALASVRPGVLSDRLRAITERQGVRAAAVVACVVVYIAGLLVLLDAGSGWARDAKRDRGPTLAAMVLVGRWPTAVTVLDGDNRVKARGSLLGSNDGSTVVYDRTTGTVLRLPTDTTTTRTLTRGDLADE